jgi:hypothetical protein
MVVFTYQCCQGNATMFCVLGYVTETLKWKQNSFLMFVKLHVTVKNIKFQHCHGNATEGSLVALKCCSATKHAIHLSTI